MTIRLDSTTNAEYAAASTVSARAAAVVSALGSTVTVKVYDGTDTEMGSGSMIAPWATSSGATITIGEVSSFTVGTSGTPDAGWYLQFAGNGRTLTGSFGLSGTDFTWSLPTWTEGQVGTLGTVVITATGNQAPSWTATGAVAPATSSLGSSGGTIQFTAIDPDGDTLTYSLQAKYLDSITINGTTGLVTVPSSAAGTSGNITVRAFDGALGTNHDCAVTVQAGEMAAVPYINHPGGPLWRHGIGQIGTSTNYNSWKTWMGHEPDVYVAWSNPATNWTAFRSGKADVGANFTMALGALPKTTLIVHAYPMFANYNNTGAIGDTSGTNLSNRNNARPQTWAEIANGQYDAHYTAMAQGMRTLIVNAGRDINVNAGNVCIRLGWEMNGDWYDHSICNSIADFKAAWARIVTLIRAVIPGMKFDFSPARPWVGFTAGRNYVNPTPLTGFIPDEQYVDFITRSLHDVHTNVPGYGTVSTIDNYTFNYRHGASTGSPNTVPDYPTQGYDRQLDLTEIATVGQAMNRPYGTSEWAVQMGTAQSGELLQSQQPHIFIEQVYNWLYTHRANICWDAYMSSSNESLYNRTGTQAAIRYKSLWTTGS